MQGASRGRAGGELCPSSLGVGPGDWDSCCAGRGSVSPPGHSARLGSPGQPQRMSG